MLNYVIEYEIQTKFFFLIKFLFIKFLVFNIKIKNNIIKNT